MLQMKTISLVCYLVISVFIKSAYAEFNVDNSIPAINSKISKLKSDILSSYTNKDMQFKKVSYSVDNKCDLHKAERDFYNLVQCEEIIKNIEVAGSIDDALRYARLLLNNDIIDTQHNIFNSINKSGFDGIISKMNLDIAVYYYENNNYDMALKYLKEIGEGLTDEQVYYGLLMYGLIYYEKNNYKQSVKYLNRIDSSSKHYIISRYNLAQIMMIQSWWGEAEEYLEEIIQILSENNIQSNEMQNLARLTLGYSKINRQNYRSAKYSFEGIDKKSIYRERAIIGMSICEIGMNDLSTAAPLLKLVTNSTKNDSYDDIDALILLSDVYRHAGDEVQTVFYYKKIINILTEISEKMISFKKEVNNNKINKYRINEDINSKLNYYDIKRLTELSNDSEWSSIYKRLKDLELITRNKTYPYEYQIKAKKLLSEYEQIAKQYITQHIDNKLQLIKDYLSQAKYSLANIYDKSVSSIH